MALRVRPCAALVTALLGSVVFGCSSASGGGAAAADAGGKDADVSHAPDAGRDAEMPSGNDAGGACTDVKIASTTSCAALPGSKRPGEACTSAADCAAVCCDCGAEGQSAVQLCACGRCATPQLACDAQSQGAACTVVTHPANDAGTDAATPGDDATAACSSIANVATELTAMQVAQDPPTPAGGTVADGTYVLTDLTVYTGTGGATGPAGKPRSTTLKLAGGSFEQVGTDDGAAVTPSSGTYTASGTTFTQASTCPFSTSFGFGYDASPTTLTLYFTAGAQTLVSTFTKR